MSSSNRDTLFVEQAEVIAHQNHAGEQYILRVKAPQIAANAQPGTFVHIQCDPMLPMRRPLSIMRVNKQSGWVEFLYREFGYGTKLLSQCHTGDRLSLIGPIGNPFNLHREFPRPLLLGGGVGIPPMVFLADTCRHLKSHFKPIVLMGSEVPFPFKPQPSQIMIPGIPEGVIAAMPLMEDWNIPSRLSSLQGYAGCFDGYITDLASSYIDKLKDQQHKEVEVFACGPHRMLEAVANLARKYQLPCQVSLEEYMACAVGGCAGCVVKVQTETGPAMKRVCVDGPVFDAYSVFPA